MGALVPIEPDHLCSLIALNVGAKRSWGAFFVGVRWGLGHSAGMLLFCLIFVIMQSHIHLMRWEYYGNYVAGLLLIGIGVYFYAYESKYLRAADDGSWQVREDACCCHGHHADGHGHEGGHGHHGDGAHGDPEASPLLPQAHAVAEKSAFSYFGDLRGAVIGLLQGLCCPSCIAGLGFVGQLGAAHPSPFQIGLFFASVFFSIIFCSAFVSASLVMAGQHFNACKVSTRTAYQASCIFAVFLGVAWIILNATGFLHVVQYTHAIQEKFTGGMGAMDAMQT